MSNRNLLIVGVLFLINAIGVFTWVIVERSRDTPAFDAKPPIAVDDEVVTPVDLHDSDGASVGLLRKRPVLVHVWATWCEPCLKELPLVLAIGDDEPFDVVTISLDDDWATIETFLGSIGSADVRVLRGKRAAVVDSLSVTSLPETVLILPDGKLILRGAGARNWDENELSFWRQALR